MVESMQDVKPGIQDDMKGDAEPVLDILADGRKYKGVGKLEGKNVLITGADSGIGAAFAVLA
jgi:NADPH:quinone reductase-like Zn-dependent oxidoreductase